MNGRTVSGYKGIETVEQAVNVLRNSPASLLATYYVGTLPFVLALVYFWADMSQGRFAAAHAGLSSLGLAVLFVWMKTWQTFFARRTLSAVQDTAPEPLRLSRVVHTAMTQTIVQSTGFFLIPLATLILAPLPQTYAFYQNVTVLDDGARTGRVDLIRRSFREAVRWPRQLITVLWLVSPFVLVAGSAFLLFAMPLASLSTPPWFSIYVTLYATFFIVLIFIACPFGLVCLVNAVVLMMTIPSLVRTLLGVESVYTINAAALQNSTFFVLACALAFLIMDPVVKTAMVLRCYYGESIRTGADLRGKLRDLGAASKRAALLLVVLIGASGVAGTAAAQEPQQPESPAQAEAINAALDEELTDVRYLWRMPPDIDTEAGPIVELARRVADFIQSGWDFVLDVVEKVVDWFMDRAPGGSDSSVEFGPRSTSIVELALYVLLGTLVAAIVYLLYRMRLRGQLEAQVAAEPAVTPPDLEDESTQADALPEDEWLRLARELLERGEHRLAVRAFFLSTLSNLAQRNLISIARYKSNRDYRNEIDRFAHAQPEVAELFPQVVAVFERVWYGLHSVSSDILEDYVRQQEQLRSYGR